MKALYEIAVTAASCDSLQRYQEKEIQRSIRIDSAKDAQIIELTDQLIWTRASLGECHSQGKSQEGLTNIEKRKKRRWIWFSIGLGVAWIGSEVLEARL